jgi:hypothetical protein
MMELSQNALDCIQIAILPGLLASRARFAYTWETVLRTPMRRGLCSYCLSYLCLWSERSISAPAAEARWESTSGFCFKGVQGVCRAGVCRAAFP